MILLQTVSLLSVDQLTRAQILLAPAQVHSNACMVQLVFTSCLTSIVVIFFYQHEMFVFSFIPDCLYQRISSRAGMLITTLQLKSNSNLLPLLLNQKNSFGISITLEIPKSDSVGRFSMHVVSGLRACLFGPDSFSFSFSDGRGCYYKTQLACNNHTCLHISGHLALSHEKRLIKDLIDTYKEAGVTGRPVQNSSEAIKLKYGLGLVQILRLDEKNQVLTIRAWNRLVSEHKMILETICNLLRYSLTRHHFCVDTAIE